MSDFRRNAFRPCNAYHQSSSSGICGPTTPAPTLLHACVAVPLNLFDLTGSYFDRERAIEPDSAIPIFLRYEVMPRRQRNPKLAVIVRCEGCDREIALLYDKGSIRKRFRIGNALFHWPTRNAVQRNRSFQTSSRLGRRRGLRLCPCNANKRSEQDQQ